jgi:hypothetical protein
LGNQNKELFARRDFISLKSLSPRLRRGRSSSLSFVLLETMASSSELLRRAEIITADLDAPTRRAVAVQCKDGLDRHDGRGVRAGGGLECQLPGWIGQYRSVRERVLGLTRRRERLESGRRTGCGATSPEALMRETWMAQGDGQRRRAPTEGNRTNDGACSELERLSSRRKTQNPERIRRVLRLGRAS